MKPGRTCPVHYRYRPHEFNREPKWNTNVLLVAGGLYGNPEALSAILALYRAELGEGHHARLVFNGDFNWFNAHARAFEQLNHTVLKHTALQGNVEAELASPSGAGCGCGYPDYMPQETVERSNRIIARLHGAVTGRDGLISALGRLPKHMTVAVGGHRVGILHGDPESLAGWRLAVEQMPPPNPDLRQRLDCADGPVTNEKTLTGWFRQAGVDVLVCSHTCLPYLQDFELDDRWGAVINNGSAGMPNFRGDRRGLISRIATVPPRPGEALYGVTLNSLHMHALPVAYDHEAWRRHFLSWWPAGSAAQCSYKERMECGPAFNMADAVRGSAELL